jgi:AcrR family transcriptional regulator
MNDSSSAAKRRDSRRAPAIEPASAATRDRLLLAARSVFAERGFAGASVREITAAACANLGAVTYHFGSKQGLYEAVVAEAFRPLLERLASPLAPGVPVLDDVERRLRLVFEHLHANPDLQFLVLQQIGRHGLPAPAVSAFSAMFGGLAGLIAEGQRRGEIRSGDALLMTISVASQPAYFGIVARFLLHHLPLPGGAPKWEDIVEHGIEFVRSGLAARPESAMP